MRDTPKLVVFDLDGTLTESKQRMSADMADLLQKLMKKMPVAVMSGASFSQFEKEFLSSFDGESTFSRLFLFPDDAAQCFVFTGGSWHPQYDHSFTETEKEKVRAAFEEALLEVGYPTPPKVYGERIEDRGAEIAFSALGQDAPLEEKENWHSEHEEKRDELRHALEKRLPEFSISEGGLTTVQVTHKGINKAYGVHRLVELTGVSISEILYVGDALQEGGNDAVVLESGVKTHAVFGPRETAALIETLLEPQTIH